MGAEFSAEEILYATNARFKSGSLEDGKGRVVWELDEIEAGDWFLAIPSQTHDPHDELDLAVKKGARGLIVNRRCRYASVGDNATVITVTDTRAALLDLVRYWRYCVQPRVIGVSGSSGRRATIVLLNALIKNKVKTHTAFMGDLGKSGCMKGLLAMPRGTEVLIFEAGGKERGDISNIGGALDPDIAVLTQAQLKLPFAERDGFSASLYCEILETLPDYSRDTSAAVICDDNNLLQKRVDEIIGDIPARRYSDCGFEMTRCFPDGAIEELINCMREKLGLQMTHTDLWCALEAVRALGLSTPGTEEIHNLGNELDKEYAVPISINQ